MKLVNNVMKECVQCWDILLVVLICTNWLIVDVRVTKGGGIRVSQ